jgi:4-amino-4-deoxy-L-arabinose transferase-like glycosyltransferase
VAGVSNLTAQLPNVLYLAGLCALLMLVACRYGRLLAGISALLLVLATRGLLDLGLRVYGEVPALCFFAVALVLLIEWEERPGGRWMAFLVGLGLGCSVLTKTVMLLALLAILVTFA